MYALHIQKAIAASTVTADFDVAAFRSPGQSIVSPSRLKICSSNPVESEARVKNSLCALGRFLFVVVSVCGGAGEEWTRAEEGRKGSEEGRHGASRWRKAMVGKGDGGRRKAMVGGDLPTRIIGPDRTDGHDGTSATTKQAGEELKGAEEGRKGAEAVGMAGPVRSL